MIIALHIVITLRFSINCSIVICSPTVIISILREATSETYGPRVYFPSFKFPIYDFSFWFTFFAIFYFPFHKPKILLYRLSFYIRSHFANNREGIDNPFIALGPSWCLFVQVFGGLSCCLLLDWHLSSQKLREILTLLCCITVSFSRENQRKLKR